MVGSYNRGLICIAILICSGALADVQYATQQASLELHAIGKVAVPSTLALGASGRTFHCYTGVLPVSFRVRTTKAGGGSLTMQAASEFAPRGGPSIGAGMLTYVCGGATLGTGCSGVQTVSTSSQTLVVALPPGACTGGGGACSTTDPNSVQVSFMLENSPHFETGTYTGLITFTISAT